MKRIKKIPDIYIIFLIYALIGWLYEVIWLMFVVPPYHFVNRGVLFGPFLPIYGIGMLMLLLILHNFIKEKHTLKNPIYLIISVLTTVTFIYTTIVEYTTPKIYNPIDYLNNYGIGLLIVNLVALIITYLLVKNNKKLQKIDVTIILVFLAIWLITTSLEYVVHYLNETFRGELLWDYSKDFLNINRRVNWDASRNFAIGGTLLLYTIQPLIDKLLKKLTNKQKYIICILICIPMIIDIVYSLIIK